MKVHLAMQTNAPLAPRPPLRTARSRVFDSARWAHYQPRADDIVIATYPKCGTTWTQRIVAMLVLQSAAPSPIWESSPWFDMRIFGPVEGVAAAAEAIPHRRFFKSHLPFDTLPVFPGMKFIHVARDGRDAAMSFHNHLRNFSAQALDMLDQVSLADPKFGDPYPRAGADPAEFFAGWVEDGGSEGDPLVSFYHLENSFWDARHRPDVLLVHYNDLKQDRAGEMRRIAEFLEITVDEELWPDMVEAAGFEAMKRDADVLLPMAQALWDQGAQRFLHKGTNGRWRDVVAPDDLARYEARVAAEFPPALADWIANGRCGGDPRHA